MGKLYRLEWDKVVRMNCTAYIEASNEEEALQKWKDGDYFNENYDESELSVVDEDSKPKIVLSE